MMVAAYGWLYAEDETVQLFPEVNSIARWTECGSLCFEFSAARARSNPSHVLSERVARRQSRAQPF